MFDDKLLEAETADTGGHIVLLFVTAEGDDKVPLVFVHTGWEFDIES